MVLLIVYSSGLIIERLANLVSDTLTDTSIYKAESFDEAAFICEGIKPDIVLLDIALPENKSIDLFNMIKRGNQKTGFIILSSSMDVVTQWQLKQLGADFILDKYHDFEKIPATINSIVAKRNS